MSQNPSAHMPLTAVRKIEADGVQVFYRAAGDPSAPVVLLLHFGNYRGDERVS